MRENNLGFLCKECVNKIFQKVSDIIPRVRVIDGDWQCFVGDVGSSSLLLGENSLKAFLILGVICSCILQNSYKFQDSPQVPFWSHPICLERRYTLRITRLRRFARDSQYLRAILEFWHSPSRNSLLDCRGSGDRAIARHMEQDVLACFTGLSPSTFQRG
ncbi:Uncharacterized protein Fot_34452 [Forsythia ovata]|uniref:Uncharacterized protein n=1 Tax=Forsythia ovata TaxID=205694 RepID=A0ABD1SLN5_9LAMI